MLRFAIITLGCKVNQYESASFQDSAIAAGYVMASPGEDADCLVINTCSVTTRAAVQSRQVIRQALRQHRAARLIITGCHVEAAAKEVAAMPELAERPAERQVCLVGNSEKEKIAGLLTTTIWPDHLLGNLAEAREIARLPTRRFAERSRACLRIQDGCESFCSYCIVPFTRGKSRSLPPREVLAQAAVFVASGYHEIIVTGIHVGYYGRDLRKEYRIFNMLDELSINFPQIRFRLSSIEPTEITDDLLALFRDRPNLMPHLHIPLQSGDDSILARMGRRYRADDFAAVVARCKKTLPQAAIGCDLLTGFPGETEQLFENTYQFIKMISPSYLHVFPYSPRPGTIAASLPGHVHGREKQRRAATLRALGDGLRLAFYRRHLGERRQILLENDQDRSGLRTGLTDNYISVVTRSPLPAGSIVQARLTAIDGHQVAAEAEHEN
ncbi:MAG: tRNA (N(6)-L-threonylcarbamoyladenosine(37)-C(2))-methylthiotransferase MtaB [Desulfobulbaceae bacterium]|jgi:threonylcarbamoyladenosine tRNA methylthiotransferase MtaB|nr:tRNA (N(6)-L-threonylcarbamoyladenosine(37)-C(2))-methylthiotransferase MtaB [Desulfobulbaceae bacterium]